MDASNSEHEMTAVLSIKVNAQLKELIGQFADRDGTPLNEYLAKVLSRHVKRPDLAAIPRKKMGRPRKPIAV